MVLCGSSQVLAMHHFQLIGLWGPCILALSHDMLHVDVPEPADGVGHHETLHQFGVAVGYVAGVQDTLVAGVPCSECPDDLCLNHHVVSPAPQDIHQWLVLLLFPFTFLNES